MLESVIARDREGKEGRACGAMPGCGVGGPHPLCSGHPAAKVLAAAARARPAHRAPAELSRGVSTPADCTPTPPSPTTIFVFSSLPFLPSRASDTVLPLAKKEREASFRFMQGFHVRAYLKAVSVEDQWRPWPAPSRLLLILCVGMRVCGVIVCVCMWCCVCVCGVCGMRVQGQCASSGGAQCTRCRPRVSCDAAC